MRAWSKLGRDSGTLERTSMSRNSFAIALGSRRGPHLCMGCRTLPTSDPASAEVRSLRTRAIIFTKAEIETRYGYSIRERRRSTSTADSSKFLAATRYSLLHMGPRGTVALYALTFTFGPVRAAIFCWRTITRTWNRFYCTRKTSENVFIDISALGKADRRAQAVLV